MAADRTALAPTTAERFAAAVQNIADRQRPAETMPSAQSRFAVAAAGILEGQRNKPEAAPDEARHGRLLDTHIAAVLQLAHTGRRADEDLYAELQPVLHQLIEHKVTEESNAGAIDH